MADEEPNDVESPAASVNDDAHETAEKTPQASSENVTYDENGEAIFTDPASKYKYKWCKVTSQWKPTENEHYKWCSETEKWIPKASTENEFYRWCEKTNQWLPKMTQGAGKEGVVYGYDEKDRCHTYTDKDGAVFFFDSQKKAWFPKVDDDFLAVYQLNYGFIDNTTKPTVVEQTVPEDDEPPQPEATTSSTEESLEASNSKKRKLPAAPPKWFEVAPEQNTKVYVSNLPTDTTEDEFGELMAKCGMVMKDLKSGKLKLKLYRDSATGELKGDGLCHYIKVRQFSISCQLRNTFKGSPNDTMEWQKNNSRKFLFSFLFSLTSSSFFCITSRNEKSLERKRGKEKTFSSSNFLLCVLNPFYFHFYLEWRELMV